MFFIGFLDDLKINIKPFKRLLMMIIILFILIFFLPIKIFNIDIPFLSSLLNNNFFSSIFALICFLFIINGANLIDGFNGLLAINLIIINIVLTYININQANLEFSFLIVGQIITLLTFLLFNFPRPKIFLGDSGAYLMGSLVSLNVIITNNLNPDISSFFYCTLLFYLFFEVFFSFFRKIFEKKNPLKPDDNHLHMLLFKKLNKKVEAKKANFLTSLILNSYYAVLILPSIFFTENGFICRYLFLTLLFIYILTYYYFRKDSFINNEKI